MGDILDLWIGNFECLLKIFYYYFIIIVIINSNI